MALGTAAPEGAEAFTIKQQNKIICPGALLHCNLASEAIIAGREHFIMSIM